MGCYGQDWAGYQSPAPSVTGLSFVFIKVTEGLTYTNPRYAAQLAHARLHKLVVGHYHYPHMGNSPAAEADRFLSVAAERPGELLCLDWEGYDKANKGVPRAAQVAYKRAFLARVRAARPAYRVGTYANKAYVGYDPSGPYGDFLWIATAGLPAGSPGVGRDWVFHQYASKSVDKDYCRLTASALRAWARKEDEMDAKDVWAADVIPASEPPVANGDYAKGNRTWRASYALGTAAENARLARAAAEKAGAQALLNAASISALAERLDGAVPEIDYAKLAVALLKAAQS
jgi:hypothetical protein